jgi:hypothetical protein
LISNRQMQGASLGEDLLNANKGTSTNSTTTGPNTMAGNAFGSLGGSMSNLSTLMMMQNMLGGGGNAPPGVSQTTSDSWGTIPGESGGGPLTSPTVQQP